MTHIKRIDEMAVRFSDAIDNKINTEKTNRNNLLNNKLETFKKDTKALFKKISACESEMVDAIDTIKYAEDKGLRFHKYNYVFDINDPQKTEKKPVYCNNVDGIVYYSYCEKNRKMLHNGFCFRDGVLYMFSSLYYYCRDGKYDENFSKRVKVAKDVFNGAFLDNDEFKNIKYAIRLPFNPGYGDGTSNGEEYYEILLDFANQIKDFTKDVFNDIQNACV